MLALAVSINAWPHTIIGQRRKGDRMKTCLTWSSRKAAILLGFATAGAIVLSTAAVTVPASAAQVTSSSASASSISPDSVGKLICSGNLCIQRVTSIENNEAYVEAWADTYTFTGHFALYGPDGWIANSKNGKWIGGGAGWLPEIAAGGGYYIIAWAGGPPWTNIGQVSFSV
jgi:hypothetical protein